MKLILFGCAEEVKGRLVWESLSTSLNTDI